MVIAVTQAGLTLELRETAPVDPEIRYARTSDGLNIAYFALGEGLTLIVLPPTLAHAIEPEWQVPQLRAVAETSSQFCDTCAMTAE
jgi:hypothetical protein